MEQKYLQVREAAKRYDVSLTWLYRRIRLGEFPGVMHGDLVRVPVEDADRWFEERRTDR